MGGTRFFCSDRLDFAAFGYFLEEGICCSISSNSILSDEIVIVHVDSVTATLESWQSTGRLNNFSCLLCDQEVGFDHWRTHKIVHDLRKVSKR